MFARALGSIGLALLAASCSEPPPVAPSPPPPTRAVPPPIPEDAMPTAKLPPDVAPLHYTLVVDVDPSSDRFAGTVEIAAQLDKPRSVVWMHGKDLRSKGASARTEDGHLIGARFEQVDPTGVAAFRTDEPIGPGKVILHIDYDAAFGKNLQGLYKTVERNKPYAFTQFESIYARQAFPSFDEPRFKTPFDVTLFVPKGELAVANTKEIERRDAPGNRTRFTFATTLPLPTYLIAFAAGPLQIVEGPPVPPFGDRKALALRGVSAEGRGAEFGYAMMHTGEILSALERYYGIAYPYDKLDILAVPEKGGAMENAGAVTFREVLVLFDEKTASLDQRHNFWSVMSHELAHQWTGDMVTMKWWDDTWLNEAFATWAASKITSELHPELHDDIAAIAGVQRAMNVDGLVAARKIRQPVRDTNDIADAFDTITYQKGGGVLAMIENFVGPAVFQRGMHAYLEKHKFGSATADDLVDAISGAGKLDISAAFKSFLDQPGVPLVEASVACKPGGASLHVKQSRYLPLGSAGSPDATWTIPMCIKSPDGSVVKQTCSLVGAKEMDVPLPGKACPAWVLPNAEAAGYYRFTLPAPELKKLAAVAQTKLDARERMAFANSVKAGFSRGTTSTAEALAALAPLARDPEEEVALQAHTIFQAATDWFAGDAKLLANVRARAAAMYLPVYKSLGFEAKAGATEDAQRKLLREGIVKLLVELAEDPGVRKVAAAKGRAYVGYGGDGQIHADAVDPNLAQLALEAAVAEGDAAFFDALVARLEKTDDEALRARILNALGWASRPELQQKALGLTLDPRLKGNEWPVPLVVMLRRPVARDAAWEFLRTHLDALLQRPSRGASLIRLAGEFCDKAHADEDARLFASHMNLEGAPRTLASTQEALALCAARKVAQEPEAKKLFAKP